MSKNKMKGIIFSTEMVQAIQYGRKTMTRKMVKQVLDPVFAGGLMEVTNHKCPYRIGQVLYVKEAWKWSAFQYKHKGTGYHPMEWEYAIYMPKEAARIFLKVVKARVERLQEISEEDAVREGVAKEQSLEFNPWMNYQTSIYQIGSARESYMSLWESIHKKKNRWPENPWVWVIEFERISKEDAIRWEGGYGHRQHALQGLRNFHRLRAALAVGSGGPLRPSVELRFGLRHTQAHILRRHHEPRTEAGLYQGV